MSSVEQIKERLNIEEVVGSYIKLEKAGNNFKARCPFHNEKTPSFFVSSERNSYYCFGCNAKGDIFSFVENFENVDFVGALKILADKAGVTLEFGNFEKKDEKERLYNLLEEATEFFQNNLLKEDMALEYLKNRGLKNETIKEWQIGYARNEWQNVYEYLKSKKFSEKEIVDAGMAKSENGKTYDRFRGRIMFPIFDPAGRPVAYSGRILADLPAPRPGVYFVYAILCGNDDIYIGQTEDLKRRWQEHSSGNGAEHTKKYGVKKVIHYEEFSTIEDAVKRESDLKTGFGRKWLQREYLAGRTRQAGDGKSAKYLNSPETTLFNKSKILYGYHKAKQAIRKFDFSIIVEGQMDLLMCHQAGFNNAVATSGTALTRDHLTLLQRISNNVIMCFDSDTAGHNATLRAWALALSSKMEVKIAQISKGKDPADLILQGSDLFKDSLKKAVSLIDFLLDSITKEQKEKNKIWRDIKEKVLPYIYLLESATEKSRYVSKISEIIGIKEEFIFEDLKKVKLDDNFKNLQREDSIDKKFESGLLKSGSIERSLASILARKGDEKLKEKVGEILGGEFKAFEENLEKEKSALSFEAEEYYGSFNEEKVKNEVSELLLSLKEEMLKKELGSLMMELKLAEKSDEKKALSILKRCDEISKMLKGAKNASINKNLNG